MAAHMAQAINRHLRKHPQRLQQALYLGWGVFILLGISLAAFCFGTLFLPLSYQLGWNLWYIFMAVAGLRLLSVFLAQVHDQLAQHSQQLGPVQQHYSWALRLTPGNPDLYCHWGQSLSRLGEYERARRLFLQAKELQPDYDEPYVCLATLALRQGQWQEASRLFDLGYRLRRGVAWNDLPERIPSETPASPSNRAIRTSVTKLNHDAQQLEFLLNGKYLPERFRPLLQALQDLMRETLGQGAGPEIQLSREQQGRIQLLYGRNVYIAPVPAFPRELLNPDLKLEQAQQTYLQQQPSVVVLDDFLNPDACEALLHFCQKSTIWHDDSRPGGYLGAYMDDGFSCDLLYQVANELRDALPQVFQGLPLKHMWAYKYDSRREGIGIHADSAVVNVNFWITPDQANLDPEHGGLLIYPLRAPEDWEFEDYNIDTAKSEAVVAGTEPIRIAYRQNRAVIFDSKLFHATDSFRFKDDYLLRRINITLLYGE